MFQPVLNVWDKFADCADFNAVKTLPCLPSPGGKKGSGRNIDPEPRTRCQTQVGKQAISSHFGAMIVVPPPELPDR
jgi:hypothetical protein